MYYTIPTIVWNECPSCLRTKNLPGDTGKFLRLEIVDNKTDVKQLIDNYFSNAETNQPCNKDNCGHIMKRMMKVDEPPPVLIIQLKRYNNDMTKKS